ncbi:P-loop containing nucleoside triphosphate hydrolase protein [Phlegmacium glaucopus]|nr:P-loop containing nucleoside triphosphate hydrolase protein [Phlegmacium glaucopus]
MSNSWPHSPPNPHPTSHPTTPSRDRRGSNTSPGYPTLHQDHSPIRPPPSTPSKQNSGANLPLTAPETPRRRKDNASQRLRGIKINLPMNLSLSSIHSCLISRLSLSYIPDDWQIHLIRRILQGYDSIFCAGTGYGKSLIFEGLAVLGGNGKLVVVISPLKALEYDQADQASSKGIQAIVLNEDTTKTTDLWKRLRTTAAMVYMSPEMALSESFYKLWKDSHFRKRLTAVVVDEAHCIDEWGDDDFRPLYRKLNTLRNYTGYEIPVVACTATARTSTFDLIWSTLGYGNRPFWGLDVGTDRPNLFYITRPISDPKQPLLDILNLLPGILDGGTKLEDIRKSLLYFDSEAACREAVQFLRKVLPPHLRSCVHAFSSDISEKGKKAAWAKFQCGEYRILCATDAAGMGCNVPDIEYVVSFGVPKSKSLSTVAQRWGRGGRDRETQAVCFLLLPKWAFRPAPAHALIHQHLERGRKTKRAEESKKDMLQRANLDERLENFINIGSHDLPNCAHSFLREEFSPKTGLVIQRSLNDRGRTTDGFRSKTSSFELTWTILDLQRTPPKTRCCYWCNPELVAPLAPANRHDPRLATFSHHFQYGLAPPTSRPGSSASMQTNTSTASSIALPRRGIKVPTEEQDKLRERLLGWRNEKYRQRGSPIFLSAQIILPPKQLDALLAQSARFLQEQTLTTHLLRKLVPWDSATESDLEEVLLTINGWRETAAIVIPTTPTSQRRARKKTRANQPHNLTIPQQAHPHSLSYSPLSHLIFGYLLILSNNQL